MISHEWSFDQVGYWSEVKLDIIKDYATTYSKILHAQKNPVLEHIYIDAFAGSGVHFSKTSGKFIAGSPTNALWINPPFKQYHFIDLDRKKVKTLEAIKKQNPNVYIHQGDCNQILMDKILPRAKREDYKRALCILDPYGLHLDWRVIAEAGRMNSVEIFLNFPIADINRNVLWRNYHEVEPTQIQRMNAYWGDESWRKIAYTVSAQGKLFGPPEKEKNSNAVLAEAFRKRLNKTAKFQYVPAPIAMYNSKNTVVYYLYFASQKPVAEKIVQNIFDKYRNKGMR